MLGGARITTDHYWMAATSCINVALVALQRELIPDDIAQNELAQSSTRPGFFPVQLPRWVLVEVAAKRYAPKHPTL